MKFSRVDMVAFPDNLQELYSGEDLGALFYGNFINFGYWDSALKKNLETEDYINAAECLYKEVFKYLDPKPSDKILEVGSGCGAGCALLKKIYPAISIVGIDYFKKHVEIAIKQYVDAANPQQILYVQGKAENIPFPDLSFNKLYTVDAFQHFKPKEAIIEFSRTLNKGGKLVIAGHFAKSEDRGEELLSLLPKPVVIPDSGCNKPYDLNYLLGILKHYCFINIKFYAIGERVWHGYDAWVKKKLSDSWDENWMVAYKKGLIDYYIVVAELDAP